MDKKIPRKQPAKKTTRKTVSRKAPTKVAANRARRKNKNVALGVSLVVFCVFVSISIVIGYSDSGQINVSNTISEKKNNGTLEEQEKIKHIPVQQSQQNIPNGGLIPTSDPDQSTRKVIEQESTGTSTEQSASSTEASASSTEDVSDTEQSAEDTDNSVDSQEETS